MCQKFKLYFCLFLVSAAVLSWASKRCWHQFQLRMEKPLGWTDKFQLFFFSFNQNFNIQSQICRFQENSIFEQNVDF